jgi:hypothetical protein
LLIFLDARQRSKVINHSYELETLAVYYAIKHFRVYLTGMVFKLVTDCNSLKLTKTKKDLPPRVASWWMYLQAFNFTIEYRKGKCVTHVDYLKAALHQGNNWQHVARNIF